MQVRYATSLSENCRYRAAELYDEAFRQKFTPIVASREHRIAILAESIRTELAIGAFDNERLLGLAGFHDKGNSFTSGGSARSVIRRLGWIKGLRALALFSILERQPQAAELLLDGIVVDPDMRGHGIGTGLLQAVCEHARQGGSSAIRLDVVDTNPGAKRLYERCGFVPLRTERHPYLLFMGFTASTTLIKKIESATG